MHNQTGTGQVAGACTARVIPLLKSPDDLPSLRCYRPLDPGRQRLELMVRETFAHSYDARPCKLPRDLLGFEARGKLLGVTGLRPAAEGRLFSEQYLDRPIEALISDYAGAPVAREHIVEAGNLAPCCHGEARWLIAAVTAYLHSAGFHWVLFTAVTRLHNAFRRMGLEPVTLALAEAHRLGDEAENWGNYYAQSPQVCFGSIRSGAEQLQAAIGTQQSRLAVLWQRASAAGQDYREGRDRALAWQQQA